MARRTTEMLQSLGGGGEERWEWGGIAAHLGTM